MHRFNAAKSALSTSLQIHAHCWSLRLQLQIPPATHFGLFGARKEYFLMKVALQYMHCIYSMNIMQGVVYPALQR